MFADVTMHSKMDYRLGSFVPAQAAEMMNKQMSAMLGNGVTLRVKGKRSYMSSGPIITIVDGEKNTITLIDPKGKRYATTTISEYADKLKAAMPEIPEAAKQMLANMKFDVKTDKTGKTDTIKGIKAEEMLVTVDADMGAMTMKLEMHLWAATPDELARVPALKEIAAYMTSQATGNDPSAMASKMFAQVPGFADKMKEPMEKMMKSSSQAVLRSEMRMIMPGSAKMMGATDPNEPFTDLTTDITELSTDAIPDSVFQVPQGYQEVKIEDLVQMMNPARQGQTPQQQPPAPAPPPAPAAQAQANTNPTRPNGVYRVGGGVTAPKLVSKVEPSYTEEDRTARVQGTVTLYVQVSPEGKAENMRILHSLSPGLDQKAMEAVRQWTFAPGTKDGQPVWVEAQIEVNFRLLDTPDTNVLPPPQTTTMTLVQEKPVGQVGGLPANTTSPVLIRKTEPEYTPEARAAKFQGTVVLSAIVSPDGEPRDFRVVRSLGMGLDEKAIECVKNWKFRPATKDSKPVAMYVTIEVNFRL
jgi:TonB family protein